MTTARKILSNTFIQVVGKVGILLISLVIAKMLATYLTVADRGRYDLVYTILAFAGIFADMGLYTISIREISKDRANIEKIIGNILTLRNVLSVITCIVAVGCVLFIPGLNKGPVFLFATIFASISTILALSNGTITSVLQVEYKMTHGTISQVIGKLLIMIFMALSMFIFFKESSFPDPNHVPFWAFQMLFIAGILGNLVMYFYTKHHVEKIVHIKNHFDWDYCKKLIKEALPYGFALVLATVYFRVSILILNFMLPQNGPVVEKTAEFQIGIYSGAIKIIDIFSVFPLFFLNATLPLMSKFIKEKNEKLQTLIQYSFDFLFLMAAPIVTGGVVLSYQIVNAINDEKYLSRLSEGFIGSDTVLKFIIFAIMFSYLNMLFNFILVANNRQYKLIVINGLSLVFNAVGNIILIYLFPQFALIVCALMAVLTEVLVLILTYIYAKKYTSFSINLYRSFKIFISSVIMGLCMYYSKDYIFNIFGMSGIFVISLEAVIVYVIMLLGLKVVNKEMISLIRKNG